MPDLFLKMQRVDYVTDQQVAVSAWRGYAEARFVLPSAALLSYSCIMDTGAPFSVLPYSVWHGRGLQWTSLGSQVTRSGSPTSEPPEWQGIPTELGEIEAHIRDLQSGLQAGPFLVVAKFAQQPHPKRSIETMALLGLNFIADNRLRLVMDGTTGGLTSFLTVP